MKRLNPKTNRPFRCGEFNLETGMVFRCYDLKRLRKITGQEKFKVEANDMGAVKLAREHGIGIGQRQLGHRPGTGLGGTYRRALYIGAKRRYHFPLAHPLPTLDAQRLDHTHNLAANLSGIIRLYQTS